MEEIFINPKNGLVGKYPIILSVFKNENSEELLLNIGFYVDFFSTNSEITYIKKIIENELEVREMDINQIYFSLGSKDAIISEIFRGILTSYERVLTILSVFSFYLLELDFSKLSETLKENRKDIINAIINSRGNND